MNASKKLTLLTIGVILILPLINVSCRVGEDDPFLSFRSRKARVAGTWKINDIKEYLRTDPGDGGDILLTTTTSDTKSWKQKIQIEGTDSVVNHVGTVEYDNNYIKFDKYGNFEKVFNYRYIDEITVGDDEGTISKRHICQEKIRGTWNFLGAVEDDFQNKERIILNWEVREFKEKIDTMYLGQDEEEGATPVWATSSDEAETRSYKNGEYSEVFSISMLKNKEMHIGQSIYNNIVYTIITPFGAERHTAREEGYCNIVLKQE